MPKSAPHKALTLIASGKLIFDGKVVLQRVVPGGTPDVYTVQEKLQESASQLASSPTMHRTSSGEGVVVSFLSDEPLTKT